jgi:hypothetical protein
MVEIDNIGQDDKSVALDGFPSEFQVIIGELSRFEFVRSWAYLNHWLSVDQRSGIQLVVIWRRTLALILCIAVLAGCGADAIDATTTKPWKLNFSSEERLTQHWQKHAVKDSGWGKKLTKAEYLQKARDFFSPMATGKETFLRKNGDSVQYRASTNEFGVLSARHVIRTYFKPNGNGQKYFERQKEKK